MNAATGSRAVVVTALLTVFAMVAFAGNSLLCRLALRSGSIDPASFTAVRVLAGAFGLFALRRVRTREMAPARPGSWLSGLALSVYAVAFSLAYGSLDAGTGTLVLFGAVQTTMIGFGIARGERPPPRTWVGLAAAVLGLLYLLLPGVTTPPIAGVLTMFAAGIAWGIYSLRGRGARDPLAVTADNFARACWFVVPVAIVMVSSMHLSLRGIALAATSGALASGLGYVAWYAALRGLAATTAAMVQLTVPVLAAWGGVWCLDETPTLRLAMAGACVLGGVAVAVSAKASRQQPA